MNHSSNEPGHYLTGPDRERYADHPGEWWTVAPYSLAVDPTVSPTAKAVYLAIAGHADADGLARVPIRQIVAHVGRSKRVVQRAIAELASRAECTLKRLSEPGYYLVKRADRFVRVPRSVWHSPALHPTAKAVYLAIVSHALGSEMFPGRQRLGSLTGLGLKGVKTAIRSIEDHGLMIVHRRPGKSNRYELASGRGSSYTMGGVAREPGGHSRGVVREPGGVTSGNRGGDVREPRNRPYELDPVEIDPSPQALSFTQDGGSESSAGKEDEPAIPRAPKLSRLLSRSEYLPDLVERCQRFGWNADELEALARKALERTSPVGWLVWRLRQVEGPPVGDERVNRFYKNL